MAGRKKKEELYPARSLGRKSSSTGIISLLTLTPHVTPHLHTARADEYHCLSLVHLGLECDDAWEGVHAAQIHG
jgi:hypothetical protein